VPSSVLLLSAVLIVSSLEVFEFFVVRKEGSEVFSMKLGRRLFYLIVISSLRFSSIYFLSPLHHTAKGEPVWWFLVLLALSLLARPRTLVMNSAGLASYSWYGLRRCFVPWANVSAVTSDWQEGRLAYNLTMLLWVFTGYEVAVRSRDGTCIEHTIQMRRQGGFLDGLRQHVSASTFDPGLFNWHP
jgi:hypothetical protein